MNQIAKRETGSVLNWEDEKMRTFIKDKYAPGSTPIEFEEFCQVARMADANPVLREVFFIKYKGSPGSIQFSIHWMIKKAEETGIFRGFTLPIYRGHDGIWYDVFIPGKAAGQAPTHCKIGVIRSDHPEPVWGIVSWAERAKSQAEWKNQPLHMIAKCAKAEALRSAIPGLSGRYITDEMHLDDTGRHHDPERPLTEQAVEAGQSAKERDEFKQGVTDAGAAPINPKKRQQIKKLCYGLGMEKATEYIPHINRILDDHGLPELPEGKDTKALTVAAGEIVLKALWEQTPEDKKEAVGDVDLEPEEDKTGLFPEGGSDDN